MRNAVLSLSMLLVLSSPLSQGLADEPGAPFRTVGYSDPYPGGDVAYGPGPLVEYADNCDDPVELKSWYEPPQYGTYFQGEALLMTRANSVSQTVAVGLPPASQPLLNTDNARLTNLWRMGMVLTVGKQFDQVSSFELTYFGLNNWHATSGVVGAGDLSIPGPLANATQDYIFADHIIIDYSATINNAEANYKQTVESLTLLAGFRYFNLDEAYRLSSTRNGFGTSDYKIRAVNNLIGGQVGAGFTPTWGRLTIEALAKFGVFGNLAEQHTAIFDFNNTFLRRYAGANTTAVSVMGEALVNGTFQVFDWLAIRGGYRFIWLNNVALAPDQFDFSDGPDASRWVDARNHLFLQGATLGAELRW